MKIKHIILGLFLFLFSGIVNAQIGIGTSNPDPSAILDIKSSNKGLLIPRLHLNEQAQIVLPANGLLMFNIDSNALEVNAGTTTLPEWISVTGATGGISFSNS